MDSTKTFIKSSKIISKEHYKTEFDYIVNNMLTTLYQSSQDNIDTYVASEEAPMLEDSNNQLNRRIVTPSDEYIQKFSSDINLIITKYKYFSLNLQLFVICISFLLQNGQENCDFNIIQEVFKRYDGKLEDLYHFAHFHHSLPYTRNLIATDCTNWTLLLLCFNPNTQTPIHDHHCECFVRIIDGSICEQRYSLISNDNSDQDENSSINANNNNSKNNTKNVIVSHDKNKYCGCDDEISKINNKNTTNNAIIDKNIDNTFIDGELKEISASVSYPGEVTFMNDSIGLHRLINPSIKQHCMTLHLYIPPYQSCNVFCQEKYVTIKQCPMKLHTMHGLSCIDDIVSYHQYNKVNK